MKVFHLNILGTDEDVTEYNRTGGDTPRFRMHRDITMGHSDRAVQAAECAFSEGEYQLVLEMPDGNCDSALEIAWELTQNLTEGGWVRKLFHGSLDCTIHGLKLPRNNQHRSSMVGDIVARDGQLYLVAGVGFTPLTKALSA